MGVPAFFRWLSRKYPSIIVHCVEDGQKVIEGVSIPNDASQPNPNNVEFDNLYLDMNGIIHPCCHPENKPAPKNEDEMMVLIFEYIDRIFNIVRPRKLLYMAIDGVAPRAKMNQQRSRRFRGSKESVEKSDEMSRIRNELEIKGADLPPPKPKEEHFDNNCITPGTPFMARLADCLHYYIHDRLNNDPGWKNIKVILSDANGPGEGEHKIMDYIRRQRASPNHDPNTHHCLCGADADLIMLGLATHEPNFTIIREEFKPNQPRPCELCGQIGHTMKECQGLAKEKQGEFDEIPQPVCSETEFIFIRLCVLREYLEKELMMSNLPFTYEFERALDDWVFMCFFVGNDFLPHLPSLEIREGAIDRLIRLYKDTVNRTGGYLTDSGHVFMERVQMILTNLGEAEDEIFKRRQENELNFRHRQKEKKKRMKLMGDRPAWTPGGQFQPMRPGASSGPVRNIRTEAYQMRMQNHEYDQSNKNAAKELWAELKKTNSSANNEAKSGDKTDSGEKSNKRKAEDDKTADSDEEPMDDVRLWEDGWKERYYATKFEVTGDTSEFRQKVARAYAEGLCWVLRYYYQGCPSWKWFFPYHYAPFASDFVGIDKMNIEFEKNTKPFNPMEQLMSVFPAASKQHLPDPWAQLMCDSDSPIIDFYPDEFKIDLNGKKFAWQGVALLPFVDEKRLLSTLKNYYPLLTEDEKRRNMIGKDLLYVRKGHDSFDFFVGLYEGADFVEEVDLDPLLLQGVSGTATRAKKIVLPNKTVVSPLSSQRDIEDNQTVCINFTDPQFNADFVFPARKLPGAIEPKRVLKPEDFDRRRNSGPWQPQIGMAPRQQRANLDGSSHRHLAHNMRHQRDSSRGSYQNRNNRDYSHRNQRYNAPMSYSSQPPNPNIQPYHDQSNYGNQGYYNQQSPQNSHHSSHRDQQWNDRQAYPPPGGRNQYNRHQNSREDRRQQWSSDGSNNRGRGYHHHQQQRRQY